MKVNLYIGTNLLDLFNDETIEVNSSVTNVNDIEKNTTEYSKDFTVPASNKNNRIFKHYYNANIVNGFDARRKVSGSIYINGLPFKLGKYKLSKVNLKNGKPTSYRIQFFGNLVNLKDILGDAELSDLDLSAYDHSYNSAVVKEGLTNSLFSDNLVYNLLVKKQYYYNSSISDKTMTDELANIAYSDGLGSNGILWNELRPSLKLKAIIEAIEVYTGLNFSEDFFNRSEFERLYLWLNPDSEKTIGGDVNVIDWDGGNTTNVNLTTNKGSFEVSNTPAENDNYTYALSLKVTPSTGYTNVPYKINFYKDDELVRTVEVTKGTKTIKDTLSVSNGTVTYVVYYTVESTQEFKFTANLNQLNAVSNYPISEVNTTASENTIESKFIIREELPKIKIIDFLKGLFKMFKLVVIPTDETNLYINSLVDYYLAGNVYDITNYIDNSSYEVSKGELLNEINFKFQEPTTILNLKYEEDNDRAFGDNENKIYDEDDELIDGSSLDYEVPFEQIIYDHLIDQTTNDNVDVMYGAIIDDSKESTNPKAHIFYSINKTLTATSIGFINESGVKENINYTLNIPSHTMTLEDVNYSTVFSEEFSEWNGIKIKNTLYKNYHKNYIDSIFDPKRRDYKFKAKLPFKILHKLALNDILKIRNDYYRIDNYNLNLLTGVAELNLISAFDAKINSFTASLTDLYVNYKAQNQSIYVTNLGGATFNKVDVGYGTDWISVSSNLNNVFISFAYNDFGYTREMYLDVVNEEATKTIRIYLNQTGGNITVDNSEITVDTNLTTADNG